MKVVVIGGTGLIGTRLGERLRAAGHEVIAAAPSTGVDTVAGTGVKEALTGADVVVDVSNSPSFAPADVLAFFSRSTANLLAAEAEAGVRHHVALSIVGADRVSDSGYLAAKVAQEELIRDGGVPYTIVRATQFFEFLVGIADAGTVDGVAHLTSAPFQPVAADDVADTLATIVSGEPANATLDLAGPDRRPLVDLVRTVLEVRGDTREVVSDDTARYFGALLGPESVVPTGEARIGTVRLADWLTTSGG
ncbi:NmrA family transcriptional regulator [Virgisporangium aliadipatigenens]|uniref:NmrA family transcriptional regulator n=1 Tax=Virgisporangium aliadipatigenens TaxID=741659 RepID=A0A8J3YFN8_9ACTN|nr:SDR family oxidoreductase [Virgisporangium aliadipatigenens]GIJ43131.1 NmrA family transcriptional regulator [Virgisporangium aliadipatigenens]